jgi:hypothetical protein
MNLPPEVESLEDINFAEHARILHRLYECPEPCSTVPLRTLTHQYNMHEVLSILRYTGGIGNEPYVNPPIIDNRSHVRVELEVWASVHVALAVCEERVKLTIEPSEYVNLYQWCTPGVMALVGCNKCGVTIRAYFEHTDHAANYMWRDPCCTLCLMNS